MQKLVATEILSLATLKNLVVFNRVLTVYPELPSDELVAAPNPRKFGKVALLGITTSNQIVNHLTN